MNLIGRFREWRGQPLKRRAELVWLLDELLDVIPGYYGGRWHLFGQWGCRLHLSHYWARKDMERA